MHVEQVYVNCAFKLLKGINKFMISMNLIVCFGWDFPVIKDLYGISSTCAVWAVDAVEFSVFTENVTDSVAVNPFCCKNNGCEITPCACLQADFNRVTRPCSRGNLNLCVCVCALMHVCLKQKIIFNVLITERFMQMREFYSISLQGCFSFNLLVCRDFRASPKERKKR